MQRFSGCFPKPPEQFDTVSRVRVCLGVSAVALGSLSDPILRKPILRQPTTYRNYPILGFPSAIKSDKNKNQLKDPVSLNPSKRTVVATLSDSFTLLQALQLLPGKRLQRCETVVKHELYEA